MTAVLSPPSSYMPRQGILLNRSPSVSPYYHLTPLPPLVPSDSSLSSSSSNLNTSDSDYCTCSTPASPERWSRSPVTSHEQKPRSDSAPNTRRIRFAPLPDPRRELFITDLEGSQLPTVFLDDSDDHRANQNLNGPSSGSNSSLSLRDQDAKLKSATPGSLLFTNDPNLRTQASESTHTLSSTATITPYLNQGSIASCSSKSTPSDLEGGDWSLLPSVSPRPSSVSLPDEPPRRCNSTGGSKWSTKLFKPLLAPLSKTGSCSTDDLHSSTSSSSLASTLTAPQSPGVEGCSIGLSSCSKHGDKSKKKPKKKREKGPEPDWVREFGMPLYRWASEGDPLGIPVDKQGRTMTMSELGEAGPEFWRSQEREGRRLRSGSGTRMLNGRVYGAKRNKGNAFANIRSEEPEFVEWGYGGMGSVQATGVGAGIWAKVQAGSGVRVGAHEDGEEHRGSKSRSSAQISRTTDRVRDDNDDGSGMSWVKRRKEQREREQRELEQREKEKNASVSDNGSGMPTDSLAKAESRPGTEPHSSISDLDPPRRGGEEAAFAHALSPSPMPVTAPLPLDGTPSTEEQHVLTAVTLLPGHFHPHHHHGRSHSRGTLENVPSVLRTDMERKDSADTARGVAPPVAADHVHAPNSSEQGAEDEEEGRQRRTSIASAVSALSSASSSSANTSEDVDEVEGENDADGEESPKDVDEDEDDEELEESVRITARSAGVEKISRHKDSTPVPDAELN